MSYHEEKKNDRSTTTTSPTAASTTTTTTVRFCQKQANDHAQQALIRVSCESLRELYSDCIGSAMPKVIHRDLLLDLTEGTPYEYYSYALREAAMAPRPSWRYVLAIVGRLIREQTPPEDLLPL